MLYRVADVRFNKNTAEFMTIVSEDGQQYRNLIGEVYSRVDKEGNTIEPFDVNKVPNIGLDFKVDEYGKRLKTTLDNDKFNQYLKMMCVWLSRKYDIKTYNIKQITLQVLVMTERELYKLYTKKELSDIVILLMGYSTDCDISNLVKLTSLKNKKEDMVNGIKHFVNENCSRPSYYMCKDYANIVKGFNSKVNPKKLVADMVI